MPPKKKQIRVLALVEKGLEPPETLPEGESSLDKPWRMEYDILNALKRRGYTTQCTGIYDDITVMRTAIQDFKPHIVFNMFEQFDGNALFDQHLVSYLELLKVPYTGCNPRGLTLARDKALSKKILTYHRVPVPRFAVFPKGRKARGLERLKYPMLVKSLIEEGSVGISRASVVYDKQKLIERIEFIHSNIGTAAIAEQFIEGRELYVGVIGNFKLQTFPVWELTFANLPEGAPAIATGRVKWNLKHQEKLGVTSGRAVDLSAGQIAKIMQLSKRVYRALCLSGYARLDYRMAQDGTVYLIEANPNPDLSQSEDFAQSAKAEGLSYAKLLDRVIGLGRRWVAGGDG